MNVLIYSHFFPPSIGGTETVVLTLATGLAALQTVDESPEFNVTVITQTPADGFEDTRLPFHVIRQPAAVELWRLIRQTDVLHVAGPAFAPILFGLLDRKPVIVEHHGFQTICPTGQLFQEPDNVPCPGHFMARRHAFCLRCSSKPDRIASFRLWALTFLRRFLCRQVAVNLMPTTWLGTRLELPRSATVHHGLSTHPPLARAAYGNDTRPLLVFVGRLVTTKGVHLLLEACRTLWQQKRSFELFVIGDGPERAALEAFSREWQLTSNVHFLGRLPQSQIYEILAKSNSVIVPSLGGEVFGMVVAENMLRGIPVVASDLGAFVEVLGDAGLSFKTGDSDDLARQIGLLLDNPSLSNQMSVAAHRRILKHFTLDHMIEGHAHIYRTIRAQSGLPQPVRVVSAERCDEGLENDESISR